VRKLAKSSAPWLFSCVLLFGQAAAPVSPAPRPGTAKVNTKDGLTYVWIPPGKFQMGCSPGDTECFDPEKSPWQVTISKGFWMGQTEVTQEAYQRVMGKNPSTSKAPRLPVEEVTWDDAVSYCKAVDMRLPTEAEWEYAARAGTTGARYGDLDVIAWQATNSQKKTHEVGGKQANAWGLYDILGNVWEWVSDWYTDDYPTAAQADPQGPADGTVRVRRGGAFDDSPRYARASFRSRGRTSYHYNNLGMRCVGN
jgi:formylglycine-generating enzyme required for sulfatase activity